MDTREDFNFIVPFSNYLACITCQSYQRWKNNEEVLEMHVLCSSELCGKHVHKHLEILCSLCKVFGKVVHHVI